jgi:CheY-like chemotaxis protein
VKLLCVEDNAVQRRMIDLMLAATGIDVDFACNGFEAIEAYQTTEYDAVLMDVEMPDMSGLKTAREIRQMEGGFKLDYTPILFIGGPHDEAEMEDGPDAGGDGHLMKPFTSDALLGALDQVMKAANGQGLQGMLRATR